MVSLVPCPNTSFWPALPDIHHSKQLYTNLTQGPSPSPPWGGHLICSPSASAAVDNGLNLTSQIGSGQCPFGASYFLLDKGAFVDMYQIFNLFASQIFNIFIPLPTILILKTTPILSVFSELLLKNSWVKRTVKIRICQISWVDFILTVSGLNPRTCWSAT